MGDDPLAEHKPVMRSGRAPGAWPFLGHVVELRRRPLRFLDSLPAHGDLVEIRLGPRRAFVVCHPELARQVLTDLRTFDRAGVMYERLRMVMGAGIATTGHGDHRRQRLIMQPAFRHEHMRGYAAVMQREITAVMDAWHDGQLIDMVDEMFRLTTGVALGALFSSRLGAEEAGKLRAAFDLFLRGIYARTVFPPAGWLPTPGNQRYDRAVAYWRGQVHRLIDGSCGAGSGRDDLVSRLAAAHDEHGRAMSGKELADQVAVLLLAGGETTSAAVVWALYLLSDHPEVLAALRAETSAVTGGGVAGWEHLPRLDLTTRVVRETLRLYPPAWAILRTCVRPARLAGRPLEVGSIVVFSPYILHRRPDVYAQPHRFDPGRWLDPVPRGSFIPFGAGATKCIGEEFGLIEATLVLASIVARWDLVPEAGAAVAPAVRSVLAPRAFPVRVRTRPG